MSITALIDEEIAESDSVALAARSATYAHLRARRGQRLSLRGVVSEISATSRLSAEQVMGAIWAAHDEGLVTIRRDPPSLVVH